MALAGYLVLNNVRAAYVEINTGVLLCTPRLRKTSPPPPTQRFQLPPSCSSAAANDDRADASRLSSSSTDSTATSMSSSDSSVDEPRALPLLARCRMLTTKRSSALYRHKTISDNDDDNDNDDSSSSNDSLDDDEPVPEDEPTASSAHGRARVVQLSGHVVEVIDNDDTATYPFSFQVNTYKPAKRDVAGNKIGSSELVDSLVLAAVDAKTKALWVKRIRHWNRFGWRDTEFVHADDNDFFALQARMLSDDTRSSTVSYASQHADKSASGHGSSRPGRRRFYRAPTGGLDLLVPPS